MVEAVRWSQRRDSLYWQTLNLIRKHCWIFGFYDQTIGSHPNSFYSWQLHKVFSVAL